MKPVYFRKDTPVKRRVMADMAYLVTHKVIRFPKWLYEDGLYCNYKDVKTGKTETFSLKKENSKKEDENFFYFPFKLKDKEFEEITD